MSLAAQIDSVGKCGINASLPGQRKSLVPQSGPDVLAPACQTLSAKYAGQSLTACGFLKTGLWFLPGFQPGFFSARAVSGAAPCGGMVTPCALPVTLLS